MIQNDDHDQEWYLWYFYDIHDHDNDFAGYDDNYDQEWWSCSWLSWMIFKIFMTFMSMDYAMMIMLWWLCYDIERIIAT